MLRIAACVLLLYELELDHLVQQRIVLSLLRIVSEMPHGIFNFIHKLKDIVYPIISSAFGLFEDLTEYLVNNVWISTVHSKSESLVLLLDLKQEWDLLDDRLLIANQKLRDLDPVILMRNLCQFREIDVHFDVFGILVLIQLVLRCICRIEPLLKRQDLNVLLKGNLFFESLELLAKSVAQSSFLQLGHFEHCAGPILIHLR